MAVLKKIQVIVVLMLAVVFSSSVCVGANPAGFRTAISEGNFNVVCLRKRAQVGLDDSGRVDSIFGELEATLRGLGTKKWTMVVFSEYFFNPMISPLEKIASDAIDPVASIVRKCCALTSKPEFNKVVMFVNFLHAFDVRSTQWVEWLAADYTFPQDYPGDKFVGIGENYKLPSPNMQEEQLRIANYSLAIYGDKPVAIYRKSTYFKEADNLCLTNKATLDVRPTHAYELGNFEWHSLVVGGDGMSDIICNGESVITRICADMNFLDTPHILHDGRIPILSVQADGAPLRGVPLLPTELSFTNHLLLVDNARKVRFDDRDFVYPDQHVQYYCIQALGVQKFVAEEKEEFRKIVHITDVGNVEDPGNEECCFKRLCRWLVGCIC